MNDGVENEAKSTFIIHLKTSTNHHQIMFDVFLVLSLFYFKVDSIVENWFYRTQTK